MLAVRKLLPGSGGLSLEHIDLPEPSPGQARVAVFGTGMCGTDLHIMNGGFSSRPPVTLGHEVAGVVDAVGSEHDRRWIGVRVALETAVTCGTCEWCRTGKPMLCPERLSIGSGIDGGFASHIVVPTRNLHALPEHVTERAAVVSEPLACVCNALADPPVVNVADGVVVIGPGAIGIIAAQVARAGGGRVTLVGTDADASRMAIAHQIGIECRSIDNPDARGALESGAHAGGVHVVVECSGSPSAVEWGMSLVRRGGRYVQMGLAGPTSVPIADLVAREVSVRMGFGSSAASWWRAMRLLDAGLVDLAPLVTDVLPLREWSSALDRMRGREGLKTVLDPRLS
jgi:L-iditol 2-dehydrogenase